MNEGAYEGNIPNKQGRNERASKVIQINDRARDEMKVEHKTAEDGDYMTLGDVDASCDVNGMTEKKEGVYEGKRRNCNNAKGIRTRKGTMNMGHGVTYSGNDRKMIINECTYEGLKLNCDNVNVGRPNAQTESTEANTSSTRNCSNADLTIAAHHDNQTSEDNTNQNSSGTEDEIDPEPNNSMTPNSTEERQNRSQVAVEEESLDDSATEKNTYNDRSDSGTNQNIKILSWNVEGLTDKLDQEETCEFLNTFDILCLGETFTGANFNCSIKFEDYIPLQSPAKRFSRLGRVSGGGNSINKEETRTIYSHNRHTDGKYTGGKNRQGVA